LVHQSLDQTDLVVLQIEDFELRQELEVPDLRDPVLRQHQHSERGDRVEVLDLGDLVVVKVKVDQVRERDQVLDARNEVLLAGQELEVLLPLQQREVVQVLLVKV